NLKLTMAGFRPAIQPRAASRANRFMGSRTLACWMTGSMAGHGERINSYQKALTPMAHVADRLGSARLLDAPAGGLLDRNGVDLAPVGQRHHAVSGKLTLEAAGRRGDAAMTREFASDEISVIAADQLSIDVPGERSLAADQAGFACPAPGDGFARLRVRIGGPAIACRIPDPMGIASR